MRKMKFQKSLFVFVVTCVAMMVAGRVWGQTENAPEAGQKSPNLSTTITIPQLDWNDRTDLQIITDKRDGVYLGHVNTVLLDDDQTILAVYPQGHASGPIQYKRSGDGGRTWSECLPTPKTWEQNDECPTLFRTVDAAGQKRILIFKSGSFPIQMAHSEDEGETWSEFSPIGPWPGMVAMSSMVPLRTGKGHYMAFYCDRDRHDNEKRSIDWNANWRTLFSTVTRDGGATWEEPRIIMRKSEFLPSEPCGLRSPDGKQIAVVLRENSRQRNSQIIFSDDEGETWTEPVSLPDSLTGDRHVARYLNDGRLLISFRQMSLPINGSPFSGDWVIWVGSYNDLVHQTEGDFLVRLKDNLAGDFPFPPSNMIALNVDCGYSGVVVQKDGTVVATTYGHWEKDVKPYILTVRIPMSELQKIDSEQGKVSK